MLVILCLPVLFLLSQRYLESSIHRQPNKENKQHLKPLFVPE